MARSDPPKERPRGGLADKRRAILAGAFTVFARDGYARASIDAISTEAGVSTRTIYNHFRDKTELFETVIQQSAAEVARVQVAIIERELREVTDLEADLIAFGTAWLTPTPDHAEHVALVRQINADAEHIPRTVIETWQRTGPLRVLHELARRFRELAEDGLLRVPDADRAARHFALLVSGGDLANRHGQHEEVAETVAAGVHAFLYGYRA
ncbi:TetR/AcrR family transcriptional regulator [Amycolatopsis cihanbeyliensis]|uniref:TetR family transcriptional regulator n=1 Tax=Amycolatopsis cihanbeyliensis TaxID=1128664 RepID=A0A542DS04_AMYCI|nr:TetR/AcrR family transcriptional regulator [Amycolatopsis cihanbeyliensis]TQJ05850.1 TetR family transcriptional regulator [Amycolatopsis cihanbeyliensis]